ncbi:hypothetical protein F4801DRAFT_472435 [Xylaria longipes]|nr:hypothetical protein F4801DRAFT_472435 [Xylaria longipes]
MATNTLHASVLALWLLIDHVLSQPTTATSSTPAISALISTSTFVSPSLSQKKERDLSDDDKIGISIGVTFAAILLVGSTAILCVIRSRRKALSKPQTRVLGPGETGDESMGVGDEPGKGKQVYYMSPSQAGNQVLLHHASDGTIYQAGGYPTIPEQTYAPQQQAHAAPYQTTQHGGTYAYSGATYPGAAFIDPSQQYGYAGPSNAQYYPEAHIQPQQYQQQQHQQQQQQQGGDISWMYPVSTTSPVEAIPAIDFQYKYLQDYQRQQQDPCANPSQYQNGDATSGQGYQENTYYVPPPHPHASELPEQRKVVELMGEGHYKEAP